MRHAKSDWKQPGMQDHDRPLNKRGRRAATLMAQCMVDHGIAIEVVLASTAVRVQETLKRMQGVWSFHPEVLNEPTLYLASPPEIAKHIHSLHDSWSTALLIGHNPGIGALVCHMAAKSIEMPTAAVAVFTNPTEHWQGSISEAGWRLDAYWKPRDLDQDL